ncbi:MAG: hypothetical protein ACMG6E_03860 [Candidatus Roizmanbacteria bacterium]
MDDHKNESEAIKLSPTTKELIKSYEAIVATKDTSTRGETIEVSDAASFFAFVYERIRTSIEFGEEHLFRRSAIQRILRRRLGSNPKGDGEGENIVRELLWGGYFPKSSLKTNHVDIVQKAVDQFLLLKESAIKSGTVKNSVNLTEFIYDLLACEVEELLTYKDSQTRIACLFYLYQVTKNKITIEDIPSEKKDQYYYVACEQAFLKNDPAFVRYHLFMLTYDRLSNLDDDDIKKIGEDFGTFFRMIEKYIKNPYAEKLKRFVKKQLPPFLILFDLMKKNRKSLEPVLSDHTVLEEKVKDLCEEKYKETNSKLKTAGIRSIIYIFATKMIFIFLIEVPVSQLLYNQIDLLPLAINGLFPPFLMGLIVSMVNTPSSRNTASIFERVVYILDEDDSFENSVVLSIHKKKKERRPVLFALFSIIYLIITAGVFWGIFRFLDYFEFHIISKIIFIFFISVVTFFGFRIRQIAKEYMVEANESFLSPFVDIIFLPIITVGKLLSNELAKINILMFVFDVLIEAPFKLIVEVIEEWMRFARQRKEEIV